MTAKEMDKMTKAEIAAFEKANTTFDETQSLEDYTTALRDAIYLWRHVDEERQAYTLDFVNKLIANKTAQIKSFYKEKEPVSFAVFDIDYCCG